MGKFARIKIDVFVGLAENQKKYVCLGRFTASKKSHRIPEQTSSVVKERNFKTSKWDFEAFSVGVSCINKHTKIIDSLFLQTYKIPNHDSFINSNNFFDHSWIFK